MCKKHNRQEKQKVWLGQQFKSTNKSLQLVEQESCRAALLEKVNNSAGDGGGGGAVADGADIWW